MTKYLTKSHLIFILFNLIALLLCKEPVSLNVIMQGEDNEHYDIDKIWSFKNFLKTKVND